MSPNKQQQRRSWRDLIALGNLLPTLNVLAAFAGTIFGDAIGIPLDRLILGLLALLAMDTLIERWSLLNVLKSEIGAIKESIDATRSKRDLLIRRKDLPRLEQLIDSAQQELWISGFTLNTIADFSDVFREKVGRGLKLRLLIMSPEDTTMKDAARFFDLDKDILQLKVKANINLLSTKLPLGDKNVEMCISEHRPSMGYFIVDPHLDTGYMTVLHYLYKTQGSHVPPMLYLSNKSESPWFEIYRNDFELLWRDATPVEPRVLSPNTHLMSIEKDVQTETATDFV